MENGKNGENCSFSSYMTGAGGARGGGVRQGGDPYREAVRRRAAGGSGGIFSRVRSMRREDDAARAYRPIVRSVRFNASREPSAAAHAAGFVGLLACVCVFSLLFALKLASSDLPGESIAVFRSAMDGGSAEEDDEQLGRLRLVQLPGLLSVFAASDTPVAPLSSEQAVTDDSFTASLFSSPGAEVIAMLSGTVRAIDPVSEHGGSVTVACKNGLEITYMGLSEITVERGQPVLQRTELGKLEGEVLYLRVTKDGRPIDPLEFLGTAARVG